MVQIRRNRNGFTFTGRRGVFLTAASHLGLPADAGKWCVYTYDASGTSVADLASSDDFRTLAEIASGWARQV